MPTDSQRPQPSWTEVRACADAAAALPPDQREAYLDARCGADVALRAAVDALLRAGATVEVGVLPAAPLPTAAWAGSSDAGDGLVGMRLGPWLVVRVLGSGGMGTVYAGRRVAGDFDQEVAIKVLHLGAGLDREIAARFLSERQILAQLDHPYIARLLDGGTLPGGAPYLVMELVEGERLSYYCDAHKLGLAERLQLMVKVCRAVQAAHRALVVHRDLKPDNILVDGHGEPKLLDFGIAKVLDAVDGVQTRADQRLLTPRYAAPEQFTGGSITTATDVYALGVILYELLAGRSPYPQSTDDVLSLVRVVCEVEPDPPSRTASASRSATRLPAERLRGDLDAIVLKAMRKRPADRYGSVEALIDDLCRYQRNEPVAARQGSRAYRARKFAARHRLALALSGVLAIGVLATALTWRHQRDAVMAERDKSRQVTAFLVELFDQADPYLNLGKPPSVDDIIRLGADRLTPSEVADAGLRAELSLTLARVMFHLGAYPRALALAESARSALAAAADADPALMGDIEILLGEALQESDRPDDAEAAYRRALGLADAIDGSDSTLRAEALAGIGDVQRARRQYDQAVVTLEQALAEYLRVGGWKDLATAAQRAVPGPLARALSGSAHDLCRALDARGPRSAAEPVCAQTLALKERVFGPDHPVLASSLVQMASIRAAAGDTEGAIAINRRVLELTIRVLGSDHANVGIVRLNLGADLRAAGRLAEAEVEVREAQRIFQQVRGPDHPHTLLALNNLANVLYSQQRFEESLALHRDVAERRGRRLDADDPDLAQSQYNIGKCLYRLRRWDDASAAWRQALAIDGPQAGNPVGQVLAAIGLAAIQLERGDAAGAVAEAQRLAGLIRSSGDEPLGLATALFLEARARRQLDAGDPLALARAREAQAALDADISRDLLDPLELQRWIAADERASAGRRQ